MRSACLDEYQHAVRRHDNLFLFGRNGRVLVLAQGFLDLLLDFQKGACCVYYPLHGWGGFLLQHSPQRCAADAQALGSTFLVAVFGLQGLLHGDSLDLFQR